MKGHSMYKTSLGAIATILIMTVSLMFGIVKLEHLILKRNPNLTTNTESLEDDEVYDSSSDEFMLAFALTSNGSKNKSVYDPRYFRWILID